MVISRPHTKFSESPLTLFVATNVPPRLSHDVSFRTSRNFSITALVGHESQLALLGTAISIFGQIYEFLMAGLLQIGKFQNVSQKTTGCGF